MNVSYIYINQLYIYIYHTSSESCFFSNHVARNAMAAIKYIKYQQNPTNLNGYIKDHQRLVLNSECHQKMLASPPKKGLCPVQKRGFSASYRTDSADKVSKGSVAWAGDPATVE